MFEHKWFIQFSNCKLVNGLNSFTLKKEVFGPAHCFVTGIFPCTSCKVRLKVRSRHTFHPVDVRSYAHERRRPETQAPANKLRRVPKFNFGEIWPANSYHAKTREQLKIYVSRRDRFRKSKMEEALTIAVSYHPVLHDAALKEYKKINIKREAAWIAASLRTLSIRKIKSLPVFAAASEDILACRIFSVTAPLARAKR